VSGQVKPLESKMAIMLTAAINLHSCNFERTIRASLANSRKERRTIGVLMAWPLWQNDNFLPQIVEEKVIKRIIVRAFWLQLN
jgi:hypothetical protein